MAILLQAASLLTSHNLCDRLTYAVHETPSELTPRTGPGGQGSTLKLLELRNTDFHVGSSTKYPPYDICHYYGPISATPRSRSPGQQSFRPYHCLPNTVGSCLPPKVRPTDFCGIQNVLIPPLPPSLCEKEMSDGDWKCSLSLSSGNGIRICADR